jgi:TonB family protein
MSEQTILLIDFDPRAIENALRSLTDAGYRVEVANDGQSGIEAFRNLQPDLVLIEPMVPRKHGFEVCKEIKSSAEGQEIPVLITTGFYTGKKHHVQAKKLYGCDDYLEKPFSGEMLLSACRRHLDESTEVYVDMPTDEEIDEAAWEIETDAAPTDDPQEMPALDDLTEDEIVAHLDALIVEQPADERPSTDTDAPEAEAPVLLKQPAPAEIELEEEAPALLEPSAPAQVEREEKASAKVKNIAVALDPAPVRRTKLPLLLGAAAVLVIAAVAFFAMRTMGGGNVEQPPPVNRAEQTPALATEPMIEPQQTVVEPQAPVEIAPSAIETAPPPAEAVPPQALEPVPKPVARKRTPRPRTPLLPDAPFTELEPAAEPTAGLESVALLQAPLVELEQAPVAPPEPKAKFGELYAIKEVDKPPMGVQKPLPPYNPIAERMRQEGVVRLRVLVSEHGEVDQIEVLENSAGEILKKTAIDAVKRWTYKPAQKDGVAVQVWIQEQVVFKLSS